MTKKVFLTRAISFTVSLLLLIGLLPVGGLTAVAETTALTLDSLMTVALPANGEKLTFTFTPEEDGCYAIYSQDGYDPCVTILDSEGNEAWHDDDSGEGYNFYVKGIFRKGETYLVEVHSLNEEGETCTIGVCTAREVQTIELKQKADRSTVIEGYEYETLDLSGLELTVTFTDDSTVLWSYDKWKYGENSEYFECDIHNDTMFNADGEFCVLFSCDGAEYFYPLERIPSPVKSITYNGAPIVLLENSGGYQEEHFIYDYEVPSDATFTIAFNDGTSVTGTEQELDEQLEYGRIYYDSNQSNVPWVLGTDNELKVLYLNVTTTIPVHVVTTPIENVVVHSAPTCKYYFGDVSNGYMEDGAYYFIPKNLNGLSFTATMKDGTTVTYDDDDIMMGNQTIDGNEYDIERVTLTQPGKVMVTLTYLGFDITYEVTVAAPLVLSTKEATEADITPGGTAIFSFVPEEDGWYVVSSENGNDPRISAYDVNGNQIGSDDDGGSGYNFLLRIYMKKGESYSFCVNSYSDKGEQLSVEVYKTNSVQSISLKTPANYPNVIEGYEEDTFDLSGLELNLHLDDGSTVVWSYDEWRLDEGDSAIHHVYTVSCEKIIEEDACEAVFTCDEAKFVYSLEIIPSPVKSVTYHGDPIELIENTNGWIEGDYYYYSVGFLYEAIFTVAFHDGTEITGTLDEINDQLERGYIDYFADQAGTHWVLGTDNQIEVFCLGVNTIVSVHILPCPFTEVTVNSAPSRQYYFGAELYGYMEDEKYCFYPGDLTGLSFTATLQDGSTVTYHGDDIDMDEGTIDGYPYEIHEVVVTEPGKATATLYYKGYAIEYPLDVLASPIEKVEIIQDASRLEYEGTFYPFVDGMQVCVTFTDGSSETVTLNEQTITYEMEHICSFKVGEWDAYVKYAYDYDANKEYYEVWCLDKMAAYTGFQFDYDAKIEDITVVQFNPDIDGTVLQLLYEDETQKTVTLNSLVSETYPNGGTHGYASTELGIGYYTIDTEENDGVIIGYDFSFVGYHEKIFLEQGRLGDLTDDGKIGADDALEVLKMVVGKSPATADKKMVADVNRDGKIGADDALEILKKVVGKDSIL
ncbi:MAG: dockerin type I repeat-containing protein [Clostridia bacterium]|nr:dockerin type I repeat-containing protein [Clostridia bacterium]